MNHQCIRGLLAACLSLSAMTASADAALTLHANEASAQIEPHDQLDALVRLPSLEVSLLARFNCPADAVAHSITVSVADSHRHYGTEEIADTDLLEVSIDVPATQIAPVSLTDFCVEGTPMKKAFVVLRGVATAQVSLHCRNQSDASLQFASAALPLRLFCGADENQDSSADK